MTYKEAVAARLRDPWFRVALALTLLAPLAALVFAAMTRPDVRTADPQQLVLGTAGPAVGLLPLLVFFLAAASPEAPTRRQLLVDHVADLVMLSAAFALGWGVPSVVLVAWLGGGPSAYLALAAYLAEVALLLAAWRGVAAVLDAPGLDSGRLHRRLFLAWLLLATVLPFLSNAVYARWGYGFTEPRGVPAWVLLVDALSPESAFGGLVTATFPRSSVLLDPEALGAWHSPWTFGALLLAWAVVPLLLALRKRPEVAPPAAPPGDAPAEG